MTDYQDRQDFELSQWPELRAEVNRLVDLVYSERTISRQFKYELFTMASVASGCRHCQSHGAYHLTLIGVETERIKALWSYETSDLFTDAERAALELMRASAQSPNEAGPEHFVELRKHYSNEQVVEIMGITCLAAWLNRWNDTIATVTDQESVDWATENLSDVGWTPGKHTGEAHEQRPAHPINLGWVSDD